MDSDARPESVWRTTPAFRVSTVIFALCAAAFTGWVFADEVGEEGMWKEVMAAGLFSLAPAAALLRYAFRSRVELFSNALVVVTTLDTHRLDWAEIDSAHPTYSGLVIRLRNGKSIVAGAVQKSNFSTATGRTTRADALASLITERSAALSS